MRAHYLFAVLALFSFCGQATAGALFEAEEPRDYKRGSELWEAYLDVIKPREAQYNTYAAGLALYGEHCAGCHGLDGKGHYGVPDLTDNDWLYGGELDTLQMTILNGRQGGMPAWGYVLDQTGQIDDVANYVLSLSGAPHQPESAKRGQESFSTLCAACHMPTGEGMHALGSANLTDTVWIWGGSHAQIVDTVTFGRAPVMPAFRDSLKPSEVRLLVNYLRGMNENPQDRAFQSNVGAVLSTLEADVAEYNFRRKTEYQAYLERQKQAEAKPRTGESIVSEACIACHGTGVLGAPKSSQDWVIRLDQRGLDQLVRHAIDGFNNMPPRGTCGDCSDDEIEQATRYMISQVLGEVPNKVVRRRGSSNLKP